MKYPIRGRMYDHRIRELICKTGNPHLFAELNIPKSTIRGWLKRGAPKVISHEIFDKNDIQLYKEVLDLRQISSGSTFLMTGLRQNPFMALF